jgi:hypothetical protein
MLHLLLTTQLLVAVVAEELEQETKILAVVVLYFGKQVAVVAVVDKSHTQAKH